MTRKTAFFEGWSWFKFNNLGVAIGTNLKFYTSLSKGLKLKVGKFWGLIPTFVKFTGEKLVGGPFWPLPPSWIGLNSFYEHIWSKNSKLFVQSKILHFRVRMAILNTIDISRRWCKLNFGHVRDQLKSCHFP